MNSLYTVGGILNPLWSIGVEEQFYLTWAPAVKRFHRVLPWICWGVLAASLTLAVLSGLDVFGQHAMKKFTSQLEIHFMAVGALSAWALHRAPRALPRPARVRQPDAPDRAVRPAARLLSVRSPLGSDPVGVVRGGASPDPPLSVAHRDRGGEPSQRDPGGDPGLRVSGDDLLRLLHVPHDRRLRDLGGVQGMALVGRGKPLALQRRVLWNGLRAHRPPGALLLPLVRAALPAPQGPPVLGPSPLYPSPT